MATIHGHVVNFVHGDIGSTKMRTQTWSVPGIHGVGVHLTGIGGEPFRVVASYYGTLVAIGNWLAVIEPCQGQIGTIETDNGSYANCLILRISEPRVTAALPYGARCELTIEGVRVP